MACRVQATHHQWPGACEQGNQAPNPRDYDVSQRGILPSSRLCHCHGNIGKSGSQEGDTWTWRCSTDELSTKETRFYRNKVALSLTGWPVAVVIGGRMTS